MAQWAKAIEVPEVASLVARTPPPIPGGSPPPIPGSPSN